MRFADHPLKQRHMSKSNCYRTVKITNSTESIMLKFGASFQWVFTLRIHHFTNSKIESISKCGFLLTCFPIFLGVQMVLTCPKGIQLALPNGNHQHDFLFLRTDHNTTTLQSRKKCLHQSTPKHFVNMKFPKMRLPPKSNSPDHDQVLKQPMLASRSIEF